MLINYAVMYKAFQVGFKNMGNAIIFMKISVEKLSCIYNCSVLRSLKIEKSKSHIFLYIPCTKDHILQASYLVRTTASHCKEDL